MLMAANQQMAANQDRLENQVEDNQVDMEQAEANLQSLQRVFTVPESSGATLAQIEAAISNNLDGFLQEHIVATEKDLSDIETHFSSADIPEQPFYVSLLGFGLPARFTGAMVRLSALN